MIISVGATIGRPLHLQEFHADNKRFSIQKTNIKFMFTGILGGRPMVAPTETIHRICGLTIIRRATNGRPYKNIRPFVKCYIQVMTGLKVFAQLFSKSWRSPEAEPLVRGAGTKSLPYSNYKVFCQTFLKKV